MKTKVICLILSALCLLALVSCTVEYNALTPSEVIDAYSSSDFEIFYKDYTAEPEIEYDHYVRVEKDGEFAHIYFYTDEEIAEAARKKVDKNIGIVLFSSIFGDTTIVKAERYGKVVIEYENNKFPDLLKALAENK